MMRRFLKILGFLLLFFLFAGWFVVEHVLPYAVICPYRAKDLLTTRRAGHDPHNFQLEPVAWTAQSRDSLALRALFIPARPDSAFADLPADRVIILLHGIGARGAYLLPAAAWLSRRGFDVLVPDHRAHGGSAGRFCTFGYYEKEDVSVWVDTLLARRPASVVGVYGSSLGGAIAIQALANDRRLRFGVIESTFNDLESVVTVYGRRYVGFESRWLARRVLRRCAELACFQPDSVQPFRAAERIHQPVFIAHGTADERIPMAFGRQNFDHLASPQKVWYAVPGAGHTNVWKKGGVEYERALEGFLRKLEIGN